MTIKDSREFTRSSIAIATRLTPVGATPIDAEVIDLSMNGILVQSNAN